MQRRASSRCCNIVAGHVGAQCLSCYMVKPFVMQALGLHARFALEALRAHLSVKNQR
jgi:hypothetical protein